MSTTIPARPALLISVDGEVTTIELPEGDSLPTLYQAIGCQYVDVVRLTTVLDMWVDDEGFYTQPVNLLASLLARHFGRNSQPYHGPALLTGFDGKGDTVPLAPDTFQVLRRTLDSLSAVLREALS